MSLQLKQALKSNALYSPLPHSLGRLIGLIADKFSSKCNCELAWPSEEFLAKKLGLSVRQIERLIKQVKLVGCFEIVAMTRRELRQYARRMYDYDLEIGHIQHRLNTYRPNPRHFMCRVDEEVMAEDWLRVLERLKPVRHLGRRNDPTQVSGHYGASNDPTPVSGHCYDTRVGSSQKEITESVAGSSVINEKTQKDERLRRLSLTPLGVKDSLACFEIEADCGGPYLDETDWEDLLLPPYLDDADWEEPPLRGGPRPVASPPAPPQVIAEVIPSLKEAGEAGGSAKGVATPPLGKPQAVARLEAIVQTLAVDTDRRRQEKREARLEAKREPEASDLAVILGYKTYL
jgi:hypothetical protein